MTNLTNLPSYLMHIVSSLKFTIGTKFKVLLLLLLLLLLLQLLLLLIFISIEL